MSPQKSGNERFVDSDLSHWNVYDSEGNPIVKQGKVVPERPEPEKSSPKRKKP